MPDPRVSGWHLSYCFKSGEDRKSLGLSGTETYQVDGIADLTPGKTPTVHARGEDGSEETLQVAARVNSAVKIDYRRHNGILPYVLRRLTAAS